eukprot:2513285-Amphidinium_carterae.2
MTDLPVLAYRKLAQFRKLMVSILVSVWSPSIPTVKTLTSMMTRGQGLNFFAYDVYRCLKHGEDGYLSFAILMPAHMFGANDVY